MGCNYNDQTEELARAVHGLTHALRDLLQEQRMQFSWGVTHHQFATKQDLENSTNKIMSSISTFAAAQNAFNDRQDAAITAIGDDIANLEKQIADLQATQGAITPEDQSLLDAIQVRAATISDKLDALNALVPPTAPTA